MPLRIRGKLLIAFSTVILPVIAIGGILVFYSGYSIHKSVHKTQSIAEERAVITNLILSIERALMPGNDYIITGDKKYIDDFYKVSDEVGKRMKEAKGIADDAEERKILSDAVSAWQNIKEISQRIFEIRNPVGNKAAVSLMEEMDYKWAYPAIKRLEGWREMHVAGFQKAADTAERVWLYSRIILFVSAFALTAAGLFLAFFYSSQFSRPIEKIHNVADAIAGRDFKARLDIRTGDEIQQLANAVNEMAVQLESSYSNLEQKVEERTRELKESATRIHSIVETTKDAMICIAERGNIYLWNKSTEEMFGYSANDAIDKDIHSLIIPERFREKAYTGFNEFSKTGTGPLVGKTIECTAVRKDGAEFPVELSISAMNIKGKWHAVGIMRDITERKKAEEKLKKHLDELERFQRIAVNREFRMKELRDRVEELEGELKKKQGA